MWFAPPAYFMGLIHGHTILKFTVHRDGTMTNLQILRHVGHESLEQSSFGAIEAVFPFLPLPDNFPDETLEVTVKLIYPDLREYQLSQN
jgi:TonB family protein